MTVQWNAPKCTLCAVVRNSKSRMTNQVLLKCLLDKTPMIQADKCFSTENHGKETMKATMSAMIYLANIELMLP